MKVALLVAAAVLLACTANCMGKERKVAFEESTEFPGSKSSFHGFDQYNFDLEGRGCKVVVPKQVADGKPWIWRAQFWGHEPQLDIAMLKRGYHVVHAVCGDALGSPGAMEHWDALYEYLRFEHLLADRAVLEGMSRGGLYVFNWAARHPDKVACIYADNPVCDFKSWPGGKGAGKGSPRDWRQCLKLYGMTEEEALAYRGNPIDNLKPLAEAEIPLIHVVGDSDVVVPVAENTAIVEKRYKALGGTIKVIHKKTGHHPHCLKDPAPLVDFILKHSSGKGELSAAEIVGNRNFTLRGDMRNSRIQFERRKRGHVAFIGGSITEMDGYRPKVCAMLKERFPETEFTFTDAGISSTCSDTGAFRLERDVLSKGPLDLFFVEFAVNDDQDGVISYDDALRGMEGVIAQARAHNSHVDIVMTFFVNENILRKLRQGKTTDSISAHGKVAAHYRVSVNNLAQELADLVNAGRMDWKKFGGTHPNDYGNTMCATMIRNALLEAWAKPLPAGAEPETHPVVALIDEKSYSKGRFLPFSDVKVDEGWQKGVPDWRKESKGMVRPRFRKSPMIHSSTARSKLTIDFTGTAIGAYVLAGPDTGIIKCTVDGDQTREIDTLHHYSGFNYPMTVMFFNELDGGEHTLELEILDNRPGRMKRGGTAFRALSFVGN